MTTIKRLLMAMLIAWSLTSVAHAAMVACYSESQGLADDGDAYFDLDNAPPATPEQFVAFNAFVDKLKGQWRGGGDALFCKGTQANPNAQVRRFDTELMVTVPAMQAIRLDMQRRYVDQSTTGSSHVELRIGASNVQLVAADDGHIRVIEKYRRAGVNDVTTFWEVVHDLRMVGSSLQYSTTRYVNGLLSSQDQRQLRR